MLMMVQEHTKDVNKFKQEGQCSRTTQLSSSQQRLCRFFNRT